MSAEYCTVVLYCALQKSMGNQGRLPARFSVLRAQEFHHKRPLLREASFSGQIYFYPYVLNIFFLTQVRE
jgi:hypothetical protein